jgi:hypothetical protein
MDSKHIKMTRPYIMCNTRNLVGPGRFVIERFNNRISVVDEVLEEPEVSHIKYWSLYFYLLRDCRSRLSFFYLIDVKLWPFTLDATLCALSACWTVLWTL